MADKAEAGNAKAVIQPWAEAERFKRRAPLPEEIKLTDAWSQQDIPLHALAMLKNPRESITDAITQIDALKRKVHPVAWMERSGIRGQRAAGVPDSAALHWASEHSTGYKSVASGCG